MTSFKCPMCGARWQEGPTRDHQEGAWCRKCIQAENKRFRDALRRSAEDLRQLVQEATGNVPSWTLTRGIRALDTLSTELATTKAELARAQEDEQRSRKRAAILESKLIQAFPQTHDAVMGCLRGAASLAHGPAIEKAIAATERRFWDETRAALAPEQKGE